jgi:RNA polymerase sigma-70 factor (ECF subfamily)
MAMREHFFSTSSSRGLPLANAVVSPVELEDQQLVLACKQGNTDAFSLLVQRYQRRIFNLVYRMVQNYDEASEITQDAFLAAWQGLPAFRGDARIATWLYRIAYNCALRQLESRKRDNALHAALQAEAEHELDIDDSQAITDAQLDAHERQEMVQEHLAHLPSKYRAVLILRHHLEMSYEEMAEILKMPVGTIKTHMFRARNLLKERLQGLYHDVSTETRG